jgi:hypothetical protein
MIIFVYIAFGKFFLFLQFSLLLCLVDRPENWINDLPFIYSDEYRNVL